jgi:hypothetical protein
MTTELEWSIPDNRHWWDEVTIEGVGVVTVSTCRPWKLDGQESFYETMMFWGPEIAGRQQIIVDHYEDEQAALWGHCHWEIPKVIARILMELRAGTFKESSPSS